MASASDLQVLAKAAADGFTLLTADRGDFGRELALTRAAELSVIRLRQLPDVVRAADVAALVLADLIPGVVAALDAGHSSFSPQERSAFGTSNCVELPVLGVRLTHKGGISRHFSRTLLTCHSKSQLFRRELGSVRTVCFSTAVEHTF